MHRNPDPRCPEAKHNPDTLDYSILNILNNIIEIHSTDLPSDSLISQSLSMSGCKEILDLQEGPAYDTRRYDPIWSNSSILGLASSPGMLLDPLDCGSIEPSSGPGAIAVRESTCLDAHQAWWRSNQAAAMIPQLDTLSGLVSVILSSI
jgi:hypothetical protein